MPLELSDDHKLLRSTVREFAEQEIAPGAGRQAFLSASAGQSYQPLQPGDLFGQKVSLLPLQKAGSILVELSAKLGRAHGVLR